VCGECTTTAPDLTRDWFGYRVDVEDDDPPAVAFYCPSCVEREFGMG
jgi:hypothetical protein